MKNVYIIGRYSTIDNLLDYIEGIKFHRYDYYILRDFQDGFGDFILKMDECWYIPYSTNENVLQEEIKLCEEIAGYGITVKVYSYSEVLQKSIQKNEKLLFYTPEKDFFQSSWRDLEIPTIIFAGFSDNSDSFEGAQRTKKNLIKRGFNPILVTLRHEGSLFGDIVLSNKLFESSLSLNTMAKCLNNFFNKLENKHHPDVFIVDLPDSIFAYDKNSFNSLGILSYLFFISIGFDVIVTSLFAQKYESEYLEMLDKKIYDIYNCENVLHTMCRFSVNTVLTESTGKEVVFPISKKLIENFSDSEMIYNIHSENSMDKLTDRLLEFLS